MRSVRLSDEAAEDLGAIWTWQLQHGSGPAARRRLKSITTALERLRTLPCLWPAGEHPGTRAFTVESCRVVYEVHPDTGRSDSAGDVVVIRVFAPGQSRDTL